MTKARTLADNFAADINGITAGTGITGGGTSGTVTITNQMATTIDAKGDLVVGTGADTFGRLAVASTAGYVLTVDSAETTGLKWAAVSGGKIAQVIYTAYTTQTDITSTSYTDTGLSASITPSATTSKVLVLVGASAYAEASGTQIKAYAQLVRGSTSVRDYAAVYGFSMPNTTGTPRIHSVAPLFYLDSPSTTSSTTYKVQGRVNVVGPTLSCQAEGNPSIMILMEVLA